MLALCGAAFGQKVQEEDVTFTETRLPLAPLGGSLQHYQFTVKTPYPENNNELINAAKAKYEQDVVNYPQKVEESKAKYEQDLANYDTQVEMARENFKIESEQYNSLTMVERMALADQKPTLKLPSKPYYSKPSEPYYVEPNLTRSITYNPEVLSSSYLKLYGFEKGTENAIVGAVTLYEFESLDPQQKVDEKKVYNSKTKQTETQRTYYYITSYKRPTHLMLSFNGQTLYDDVFAGTSDYSEMNTPQRPNMFNVEKQSVEDVLSAVNEYINDNYGFTPIQKTIKIGFVKNKDGEYDDLENAKDYAIGGLKNLTYGEENADLEKAITIWETALGESDLEDKKARIDAKVTEEILFNLSKVYLATYKLEKAEAKINALKELKLSYSEKQQLDAFEVILKDKQVRLAANQG